MNTKFLEIAYTFQERAEVCSFPTFAALVEKHGNLCRQERTQPSL
jgi:hypothetical protein